MTGPDKSEDNPAMTDTIPDRLSASPDSPYYNEELLSRGIGVRFKGEERTTVEEYCISEGWVRLAVGKSMDRRGRPMTIKVTGPVEVWIKDSEENA
ncbi:glutathione peroxidase [Gluconobacter kanchanaburiensis NBRC 103587]|uniref:Glutathione peroxidase n=2 Tax=Gluconobacter kanchanaburiensis TaxID=563199 RepID=A0A511B7F8_9PROT|nr:glutathione peroxidase [Gluconobacter kanchanaburiensis NBRC 103587]